MSASSVFHDREIYCRFLWASLAVDRPVPESPTPAGRHPGQGASWRRVCFRPTPCALSADSASFCVFSPAIVAHLTSFVPCRSCIRGLPGSARPRHVLSAPFAMRASGMVHPPPRSTLHRQTPCACTMCGHPLAGGKPWKPAGMRRQSSDTTARKPHTVFC